MVVSLSALGCTEDVGSCDDPLKGQDTVLVGKTIQYGGQAIINASCASGVCHSSLAKGAARHGAPAGLDFDVAPYAEGAEKFTQGTLTDSQNRVIVKLTDDAVSGLRARQRMIFEKRNEIWAQVKDGLMPPDGDQFKAYRELSIGIKDSDEASPCTGAKNAYLPITTKPTQDVLRNWLACNTPIVESNGADVAQNGVPGQAGYQYISCGSTPIGDGGAGHDGGTDGGGSTAVVTLEDVQNDVFQAAACAACHPSMNPSGRKLNFSSIDLLYAALVTDTTMKCNGKPYITPGEPSKSWFYDVLSMDKPGCNTDRMPQNLGALSTAQLKEVSDWITQGAKRASDVNKSKGALAGGLDAVLN
ncbi:MAG: hypothetical protein JWN04_3267 [Myxococcaceae bacterium]|nr:hypothetical protein [Myxococcaceae bacterium]